MPKPKAAPDLPVIEDNTEVTVAFNDSTFTIPRKADDWPTVAWIARLDAESSGLTKDWLRFVELLLGQAQWKRLIEVAAGRKGDFTAFVDVLVSTIVKECAL